MLLWKDDGPTGGAELASVDPAANGYCTVVTAGCAKDGGCAVAVMVPGRGAAVDVIVAAAVVAVAAVDEAGAAALDDGVSTGCTGRGGAGLP